MPAILTPAPELAGLDEVQIRKLRQAVLKAARDHQLPPEVVAAALADVVAVTAARLDLQGDHRSLHERMGMFNKRVEHTYRRELMTGVPRPFRG